MRNQTIKTLVRIKAAWRYASRRSPKPRGVSPLHLKIRLPLYLEPLQYKLRDIEDAR
jgi:hypothetical protein